TVITNVIGANFNFDYYHRWFDVIFLLSALSSVAFIFVLESLQRVEGGRRSWDLGSTRGKYRYRAGDGLLGKGMD
ncbi:hypothetical protein HK101_005815, partial [Irineochytrium annulatum]